MANIQISQLPSAGAITGSELVPIVQNGVTVQTTTGNIAASPSQTQTFLTVGLQASLPNSRYFGVGSGLTITDGGAQGQYQISPTGELLSLINASTGMLAKTSSGNLASRSIQVTGQGLTISNGSGVSGDPTIALDGLTSSIAGLSGYGQLTLLGTGATIRQLVGTASQITISDPQGTSGNPTFAIADNPVLPGVEGVILPTGNTGDRPTLPTNGIVRYNSQTQHFEGYQDNNWRNFGTGDGSVTSVNVSGGTTGLTTSGGPITTSGTITLSGTLGAANGGTGFGSYTAGDMLYASGTSTLSKLGIGTSTFVMTSTGSAPTWSDPANLIAGGIANGNANEILYQIGSSNTGFITAPSSTDTFLKWNGSSFEWAALPGAGTVTSVGLSLPSEFTVTNSPVTSSGTLTGAWANQTANIVFAGPSTGGAATPSFRALVNADLPLSGVTPNTYGSSTTVPVITVDDKGLITSVTTSNIVGGLDYQGSWNASTNTPTLASGVGTTGYYYIVSVAGTTNLDGVTDWQIGDWAIFNGTAWQKIDQTNLVASVNGQTGVVVLDYTDVGAPSTSGTNATGTWAIDISGNATTATTAAAVANSVTFNNSGSGGSSAQTFNGSAAITVSYNTLGAANSGANTNITSIDSITGGIATPDFINFDSALVAAPTTVEGGLYYNNDDNTATLQLIGNNSINLKLGEEQYYRVKASSTITKGQVLMFTGTVGASGGLIAAPATGLTAEQSSYILGVATENIANGAWGYTTFFGEIRGLNTTGGAEAWADGTVLYYNPAVTGGLTKNKPAVPNAIAVVAAVVHAHASNGILFVRPTYGSVLGGTDGNVSFGTLSGGDVIVYDAVGGYWKNVAQSTLTVGSATNATNVAVTADATNATRYLSFYSATTGNLGTLVDSDLTYNPSTNTLTAANIVATSGISGGTF